MLRPAWMAGSARAGAAAASHELPYPLRRIVLLHDGPVMFLDRGDTGHDLGRAAPSQAIRTPITERLRDLPHLTPS